MIKKIPAYCIAFLFNIVAYLLDFYIGGIWAGLVLILEACLLGIFFYHMEKSLVSFRVLLSVFWIGGEGLAAFRLSSLHKEWTIETWLCFSLFYIVFLCGYDVALAIKKQKKTEEKKMLSLELFQRRLFHCIVAVTAVSGAAFLLEAAILGYIPLFSTETHAYNYFHISGVHYFTVSCMFVPALSTIYFMRGREKKKAVVFCNLIAFAIPIMCVSKFQIALAILLPAILYLLMSPEIPLKKLLLGGGCIAAALVAAAVVMTFARHYPDGYLASIFEMKNENTPTAVQYVYMYIANNYANFNELTMARASGAIEPAYGMKQLYPLFALTGLKFINPALVNFPIATTKETLNTLTIIYDAYYDFGIIGVVFFSFILGFLCAKLAKAVKNSNNPILLLLYGQIAIYLMLSFFSSWFTVPTTWFWFAITGIMYFYTAAMPSGLHKR